MFGSSLYGLLLSAASSALWSYMVIRRQGEAGLLSRAGPFKTKLAVQFNTEGTEPLIRQGSSLRQ